MARGLRTAGSWVTPGDFARANKRCTKQISIQFEAAGIRERPDVPVLRGINCGGSVGRIMLSMHSSSASVKRRACETFPRPEFLPQSSESAGRDLKVAEPPRAASV